MDAETFCRELERCKLSLYRLALGIVRNEADAEDAAARAVLRGFEARADLRKPESFRPWLLRITANEAYAILRGRDRVAYLEELETEPAAPEPPEETGLWQAVLSLPESLRAVVTLYYYDGYSVRETARILSLTEGAVKTRLSRARDLLRKLLEKEDAL